MRYKLLFSLLAAVLSAYLFATAKPQRDMCKVASDMAEPIIIETIEEDEETEPAPVEVAQKIIEPAYSDAELLMLAKMTMAEAEGECIEGKCLIVNVILNRIESDIFPNTIEEVIAQENQFTSYINGRYKNAIPSDEVWEAVRMVCEEDWDESQNALFFERATKKETWQSQNRTFLFQTGNHNFYY